MEWLIGFVLGWIAGWVTSDKYGSQVFLKWIDLKLEVKKFLKRWKN